MCVELERKKSARIIIMTTLKQACDDTTQHSSENMAWHDRRESSIEAVRQP